MDFFMSAEREADVRDGESYARKKISPILTELLNPVVLDSGLKSWSFISIILSDTFLPGMPEIIKLNKKNMEIDCRVHIDHDRFKEAGEHEKIEMMLDAIERSIKMMSKYKIIHRDQSMLHSILSEARKKIITITE